eukprot:4902646-Lingulodinium_polyedra.AAC.1
MAWIEAAARGTRSASAAASTTVESLTREVDAVVPADAGPADAVPVQTAQRVASGSTPEARRTAL